MLQPSFCVLHRAMRSGAPGIVLVLVLLLLALPAKAADWSRVDDSVERLRQALLMTEEASQRSQLVQQAVAGLQTCRELREALLLSEWRDRDDNQHLASMDQAARNEVERRFITIVQQMVSWGDVPCRLGVYGMLSEIGDRLPPTAARTLGRVLADVVRRRDPADCLAAVDALSRMRPDLGDAVAAFGELLRVGTVSQRRSVACGQLNLIRSAAEQCRVQPRDAQAMATAVAVGSAVVPLACDSLHDPDAVVRRVEVEAIHQILLLLDNLLREQPAQQATDSPTWTRVGQVSVSHQHAAWPLIQVLDERAPALRASLSDADASVRQRAGHALEALAKLRQCLEPYIERQTPAVTLGLPIPQPPPSDIRLVQLQVPTALPAVSPVLTALMQQLRDPHVSVRRAALDALEALGPTAVPATGALIQALTDRDRFVRWAAARTLGKLGPIAAPQAVPPLIRLLDDPDLGVECAAANALRRFGSAASPAVPRLTRLVQCGDSEQRTVAIAALQGIGPAAAASVPALGVALSDPWPDVRRAAAELLRHLGPSAGSAAVPLGLALADPDADVRRMASDALLAVSPPAEPIAWTATAPFTIPTR